MVVAVEPERTERNVEPERSDRAELSLAHAGEARALVVDGPDAPREVRIPKEGLLVGMGPTCGLQLGDRRVSRAHLQIAPDLLGFRIKDLGSTNGTFVDGVRIDEVVAPVGTLLQLGMTAIRLIAVERHEEIPPSERTSFGGLIGRSLSLRKVFGLLERIVHSEAPVLIEGETGTGKDVVARALHEESKRAGRPFVALDCGAIAANLAESELFGHVRGAFTGAVDHRPGAFERADGGTLFLDELGELPLDLQPKLLRVLETREVTRVGGGQSRHVDVRIVAGTHRHVDGMVASGGFRADLFYRLAVVRVQLPPLRGRIEDLEPLVEKFLRDEGVTDPGPIAGPNLERLAGYAWPGNARELRNVLSRAVACAGTTRVRFDELSIHFGRPSEGTPDADLSLPFLEARDRLVEGFERRYFTALLRATGGNVAEASRRSKLNRRYLYDLLKKHGLP
jgi:two-component system, NtrC family, nitrogen regulation response regulator GlnG